MVEHRTENPCVPGSIPGGTTSKPAVYAAGFFILRIIDKFLQFCIENSIFEEINDR